MREPHRRRTSEPTLSSRKSDGRSAVSMATQRVRECFSSWKHGKPTWPLQVFCWNFSAGNVTLYETSLQLCTKGDETAIEIISAAGELAGPAPGKSRWFSEKRSVVVRSVASSASSACHRGNFPHPPRAYAHAGTNRPSEASTELPRLPGPVPAPWGRSSAVAVTSLSTARRVVA